MDWEARSSEVGLTRRALLAVGLGSLLPSCPSDRWQPNTALDLQYRAQPDIFARVLLALRDLGYPVQEQDAKAGYLRVVAKTGAPGSWFIFRFYRGTIRVHAYGELVRDNDTVRRTALDDEMRHMVVRLQASLDKA
jgi:hypothetical protein